MFLMVCIDGFKVDSEVPYSKFSITLLFKSDVRAWFVNIRAEVPVGKLLLFAPKALPPLDTFSESSDYLEPARRILLLLILTSLLSLSYVSLSLSTGMVVNLSLVT